MSPRLSDEFASLRVTPGVPEGSVRLGGAKNSALRLLVASVLTSKPVVIRRFPEDLLDIRIQVAMLERLGKRVTVSDGTALVEEPAGLGFELEWDGRSIRNTLLLLGALLGRFGQARVPLPGGCDLGERPFDLHEQLIGRLGATVWIEGDRLCARHPAGRVSGGSFSSPVRSTGVTENAILLGASNPEGVELHNPHLRPEVLDLLSLMESLGAEVSIDGAHSLRVRGPEELGFGSQEVIPDRDEAVTWAAAAIIGRGRIRIDDFPLNETRVAREYLSHAGAELFVGDGAVIVESRGPQPFDLQVGSHPGVHSDMNPLFGAIAAHASGRSEIRDARYPKRFGYLDELRQLGLRASSQDGHAVIDGSGRIRGGTVRAVDLRGGMALILAAVGADDSVTVHQAWQVLRGYSRFTEKLTALGIGWNVENVD
jgi:UDP-N-acetylglucosamine 1-carboxyvinyltransferase